MGDTPWETLFSFCDLTCFLRLLYWQCSHKTRFKKTSRGEHGCEKNASHLQSTTGTVTKATGVKTLPSKEHSPNVAACLKNE